MISKKEILAFFNKVKKDVLPFLMEEAEKGTYVDEWQDHGEGIDIAWIDNELGIAQDKVIELYPEYEQYRFELYSDKDNITTEEAIEVLQNSNKEYVRLVFSYYI